MNVNNLDTREKIEGWKPKTVVLGFVEAFVEVCVSLYRQLGSRCIKRNCLGRGGSFGGHYLCSTVCEFKSAYIYMLRYILDGIYHIIWTVCNMI